MKDKEDAEVQNIHETAITTAVDAGERRLTAHWRAPRSFLGQGLCTPWQHGEHPSTSTFGLPRNSSCLQLCAGRRRNEKFEPYV